MSVNSERDRLLAVATPEEWDCWLTKNADIYALEILCQWQDCATCTLSRDRQVCEIRRPECLFCEAFKSDCIVCNGEEQGCQFIEESVIVDQAIARLERAGIWEDEGCGELISSK